MAASISYAETLRRLGMRPAGGNHRTLRRYVEQVWRIPNGHFDPDRARNDALRRDPIALSNILVEASTYPRGHLKARLFRAGMKTRECGSAARVKCGAARGWR